MEALGRLIGKAGFVLHAAAVEINGRGLALVYPKEVIHPTPTWGLMEIQDSKFVAEKLLVKCPSKYQGEEVEKQYGAKKT